MTNYLDPAELEHGLPGGCGSRTSEWMSPCYACAAAPASASHRDAAGEPLVQGTLDGPRVARRERPVSRSPVLAERLQ